MINTVGTNNLFSSQSYSNSLFQTTTSPTNSIVNLLSEQYQPSTIDTLSASWDLLTQNYSPQSVLAYYQQQQNTSPALNDSFQQQVVNEIQSNPTDAITLQQDSTLTNLIKSQLGGSASLNQESSDNLSALAGNYEAMEMYNNTNLNYANVQQGLTEIQQNPVDTVQVQQEQETSQLLQSQFGALGNNLDVLI